MVKPIASNSCRRFEMLSGLLRHESQLVTMSALLVTVRNSSDNSVTAGGNSQCLRFPSLYFGQVYFPNRAPCKYSSTRIGTCSDRTQSPLDLKAPAGSAMHRWPKPLLKRPGVLVLLSFSGSFKSYSNFRIQHCQQSLTP